MIKSKIYFFIFLPSLLFLSLGEAAAGDSLSQDQLNAVIEKLEQKGHSRETLEKIGYKNFLRVMTDNER